MNAERFPGSNPAVGERPSPRETAESELDSCTIDNLAPAWTARPRPVYAASKRALDLVVSLALLIILSPLLLLVALVVRLTSPGPMIFRQARCGIGGRMFTCYKFRTMIDDADVVLTSDAELCEEFLDAWKLKVDPRITPIGAWLRKTSIDELPQLINVARGHMSLVGPRPVRPGELQMFGGGAADLTSVKPGMTGLWQVSGRSTLSYEKRVELDLEYVRNGGFWYDVRIILRTVPVVLTRKGAI